MVVSATTELTAPGTPPYKAAAQLALAKATAVHTHWPGSVILAADTIVELDGRLLGKPRNADEAAAMLRDLRGRWHRVWSGLALYGDASEPCALRIVSTDVRMRSYGDDEVAAYVASGDPMDKAAAYAIQHPRFRPVASVQGCYANVMGLPLCELQKMLRAVGIAPPMAAEIACPAYLGISCVQAWKTTDGAPPLSSPGNGDGANRVGPPQVVQRQDAESPPDKEV